jgi:hypothetical protein
MRGKFVVILILLVLLIFTVYQMMEIESSLRKERTVQLLVEDESKPLITRFPDEQLRQAASSADYYFTANGNYFQKLDAEYLEYDKIWYWEDIFLKGVNLGVAVPGKFPAEFSLTFSEYLDWLILIGQMNANTVRIYTILPPEFYEAFSYYNLHHQDHPLYLMQGVWAKIPPDDNYFNPAYTREYQKEIIDVIDVIHGNAVLEKVAGKASGTYATDVSRYTAAFLLGREWEPLAVHQTNRLNDRYHYNGDFISLNHGNAMEVWLAEMMDFTILYETQKYSFQHPISVVNWLPLDPMYHNTEIIENEKVREYDNDLESIDFMKFHATDLFFPGIYAAYHAYPYYPDFAYLQPSYQNIANREGITDPYYGYLLDLKDHCQGMPLVIAEYGLPSSRGNSHYSPFGFHQGGHSEAKQAQLSLELTKDIVDAGCAGAIYFEWVDEWFKHNWLVMDFEQPFENRKLWHNMENPEQNFGIMAMESRTKTVDGDLSDWDKEVIRPGNMSLEADADAGYFYLAAEVPGVDLSSSDMYIAIDTYDEEKGDHRLPFTHKEFSNGFEFLVELRSTDSALVLVDEPYSVFTDIYNDHIPVYSSKYNSNGEFVHQLMLSNRARVGLLGKKTDSVIVDRSSLVFGNSSEPVSSNADWYFNPSDHVLELRLDWHLLNVSDPSKRYVLDDKDGTDEIEFTETDGFNIYLFVLNEADGGSRQFPRDDPYFFTWEKWDNPEYNQRLKPIYDSLQALFSDLAPGYDIFRPREVKDESFEIAGFYNNKPGAVSISFDNAGYSQYQYAIPILEKYGLSAGFGVIPSMLDDTPGMYEYVEGVRMKRLGMTQLREIAENHEICLQVPADETIPSYAEVLGFEQNTNATIHTIHMYEPSTDRTQYPVMFAREITGKNILPAHHDGIDFTVMNFAVSQATMDSLMNSHRDQWSIFNYKHLYDKRDSVRPNISRKILDEYFIERSNFEKQVRLIRNSGYWIAPESDVFKYLKEREMSELQHTGYQNFLFLRIVNELDMRLYDHPLTIRYTTAARTLRIKGSEADGIYTNRTGTVQFNAMPNTEITIERLN